MKMGKIVVALVVGFLVSLAGYSCVGTSTNVRAIRQKAPLEMAERNWKILRYEGYEYGSWSNNGGKVWYHVANIDNPSIQYRVYVTMWGGELQYCYGAPEKLERLQAEINIAKGKE